MGQERSGAAPGGGTQEDQDGEDLQPAHDHGHRQHRLGQGGELGEAAHRADLLQAGAHVAQTGEGGGEGDGEGHVVQGDDQSGPQQHQEVAADEGQHGAQGVLGDHLAVQLDHLHQPGVGDLPDLPADGPQEEEHPGALDAAAGGAGAGPHEHEQNENY